jgi:hypothetical protein
MPKTFFFKKGNQFSFFNVSHIAQSNIQLATCGSVPVTQCVLKCKIYTRLEVLLYKKNVMKEKCKLCQYIFIFITC